MGTSHMSGGCRHSWRLSSAGYQALKWDESIQLTFFGRTLFVGLQYKCWQVNCLTAKVTVTAQTCSWKGVDVYMEKMHFSSVHKRWTHICNLAISKGWQVRGKGGGGEESWPTLTATTFFSPAPGADEHADLAWRFNRPLHIHADGLDPHCPRNQTGLRWERGDVWQHAWTQTATFLLAWCPPETTEILPQVEILFSYCLHALCQRPRTRELWGQATERGPQHHSAFGVASSWHPCWWDVNSFDHPSWDISKEKPCACAHCCITEMRVSTPVF